VAIAAEILRALEAAALVEEEGKERRRRRSAGSGVTAAGTETVALRAIPIGGEDVWGELTAFV
jgi:hypothetical protein